MSGLYMIYWYCIIGSNDNAFLYSSCIMAFMFVLSILPLSYGLDLSSRDLMQIPSDLSSPDTTLDLSDNLLTAITANTFTLMPNLSILDLSNNNIDTVEERAFVGLPILQELHLNGNKLRTVPNVSSLTNLKHLNLNANPISAISYADFEALKSLSDLRLAWISVNHFPRLPYFPKMKTLLLFGNKIRHFPGAFWESFPSLRQLWLQNNKLSSLPELENVKRSVVVLRMRNNWISSIPNFAGFIKLEILDLSDNYISAVPEESLSMLTSGKINLDGNPIPCVNELCWLTHTTSAVTVTLTCQDGTPWSERDPDILCEGTVWIYE